MYKPGRWDQFKAGLDPVDQALVDRLSKLKDQDKQPSAPTTEEIQRRLAELKDQNPDRKPPINVVYFYLFICINSLFFNINLQFK